MSEERLQKILAAAGVDSRRRCEELILAGVVRVNGKVVDELPVFADAEKDKITVDGRKLRPEAKVYFLLNKPKGVVCTNRDPQGRKKAIDLVTSDKRLITVGRLDAETTGIIIVTNDTQLANKLTHPRYRVPKRYVACVKGRITGDAAEKLKKGVWLAEGRTGKASVKILKRGGKESLIEITIRQGLNRQVRRMLSSVGLPVRWLKRTRIGRLSDRGVGVGKFRALTKAEVAHLKQTGATSRP